MEADATLMNLTHVDSETTRVTRWAPLAGRWAFTESEIAYEGPAGRASTLLLGMALAGPRLREGEVCFSTKLTETDASTSGLVLGFQSLEESYFVAQIGAFGTAYAISEHRRNEGARLLASAGHASNLPRDQWMSLRVGVHGQRVTLHVDGVTVLHTVVPRPLSGSGFGLFAWGESPIRFRDVQLRTGRSRAFVVMPFAEPFDTLYRDVIHPIATSLEFEVRRVDEIHGPGIILDDVRREIEEAHVVVAEVSSKNPNVFYELGYAHALRKPVVLLCRRLADDRLPFDIQGYRAIFYDDSIGGKRAVEKALQEHLEAVVSAT